MKSLFRAVAALSLLSGVLVAPAFAAGTQDPDRIAISVADFDSSWFGTNNIMKESVETRVDYRFGNSLLPWLQDYFKVKPWAGLEANSEGFLWAGGGIYIDAPIGKYFYISPSFGPGIYTKGQSKKLGAMIEFRSTFEAGIRFSGDTRLGFYISHISNAKMTRLNPGVNMFGGTLSIPIGSMFPSK